MRTEEELGGKLIDAAELLGGRVASIICELPTGKQAIIEGLRLLPLW